jgi:Spy/CpxP family protein refolding chaperone
MKIAAKFLLASALGLLAIQPLSAQPMPGSMPGGHEGMGHMGMMHDGGSPFMMLLKSANLTEAQRKQVHEILKADRAQMRSVEEQFHAIHEQLADKLLSPGTVTAAELAPLEQKAYHYQQQIDQHMVDTALAIRNILTTDQINHLAQVHKQLQALHSQIQSIMGTDQQEMGGDQPN